MNASENAISPIQAPVQFGRSELRPRTRELRVDGKLAALGSRTFDLLLLLVESAGELVTKERILTRVWSGMMVEENTIQVHMSMLRKALGADRDFLKTVSGRGYRFVGELSSCDEPRRDERPVAEGAAYPTNLPASTSDLIGREADLAQVIHLATTHRLVTLVGAGGMGKTRMGLEVARRLRERFADGVWLAELGSLRDSELVAPTVAAALRLESAGNSEFAERIARGIQGKSLLVVLDDCDHVIGAASRIAEAMVLAGPTVRVIATSREPLLADGERIFHVPALDMVQSSDDIGEILASGSVQLFMARARAAEPRTVVDEHSIRTAACICRRLDGIPLAIELAAARVPALGVAGVAARLDDRFALLDAGRRTALPRHQTLRATMDFSYDLLQESERATLRRLSVFSGAMSLAAASAVIADGEHSIRDVERHIATLVAKSLVVTDVDGSVIRYRMLETTRRYAGDMLAAGGEPDVIARRHALHFLDVLQRAEAEADTRPVAEWLAQYGPSIDDVRGALAWAFSSTGDPSLAVALTVAAVPLWFQCSLADECRERVDRALSRDIPDSSRDLRAEMRLLAARSETLRLTSGHGPETHASWTRTHELATSIDNAEYQLRALWELSENRLNTGELGQALALGRQLCELARLRGDAGDLLAGERTVGHIMHLLGDHDAARQHLQSRLGRPSAAVQSHFDRYRVDQGIAARCILARILWLEGFAESARAEAAAAVRQARDIGHADSLRYALAHAACRLSLLDDDLDGAERSVALLRESFTSTVPRYWLALSRGFEGQIRIERGEVTRGLDLLQGAIEELRERRFEAVCRPFLGALALGLAAADRLSEALTSIEAAIAYASRSNERWSLPEWLRIKAHLVMLCDPSRSTTAELLLHQGLDCARHQGAVVWQQRCQTSLDRLSERYASASHDGPPEVDHLRSVVPGRDPDVMLH